MGKPSSSNSTSRQHSSSSSRVSSPGRARNPQWEAQPVEECLADPLVPEADRLALNRLRRFDEWRAFRARLRVRAGRSLDAALSALGAGKSETALALLAVVSEYRELIAWADTKPPLPDDLTPKPTE